ncbi:hypothetical protein RJ640_021361 [Escallonia rubra]|uniref:Uncharacterized protein n=1 Tax=Escallonia rubra TaxID=112253 RepID=A0AA88QU63_9ASTE|nr:hypothetical protein RJ640_021361 [Escallonia rubra]
MGKIVNFKRYPQTLQFAKHNLKTEINYRLMTGNGNVHMKHSYNHARPAAIEAPLAAFAWSSLQPRTSKWRCQSYWSRASELQRTSAPSLHVLERPKFRFSLLQITPGRFRNQECICSDPPAAKKTSGQPFRPRGGAVRGGPAARILRDWQPPHPEISTALPPDCSSQNTLQPKLSRKLTCANNWQQCPPSFSKIAASTVAMLALTLYPLTHLEQPPLINSERFCNRIKPQAQEDMIGDRLAMVASTRETPYSSGQLALPSNEIVDVNGYKVKASIAMVLAATIEKDGDIVTNCLHKSASMKALLLEVVCSIFQRLLSGSSAVDTSGMEDIENGVLDAEAANLEVSWLQDHLARFLLVEKTGQRSSLLKEESHIYVTKDCQSNGNGKQSRTIIPHYVLYF